VKPTVIRTSPVPLPSPAITVPETTVPLVTGPGTVHQAGSSLLVEGPFYGMKAAGGNYIDLLTFDLVKAPWADPVDMENVQVTLTRYSQITGLRFEVAEQRDANGDNILADGETFVITVPVKPDFWIYRNDRFELRVLAPGSPPILVQSQVPAVLEERTVLAEP
jgi:archaellin